MNQRIGRRIESVGLNLVAVILIIFIIGPLVWVAVASIQGENELLRHPPRIIPHDPTLDNYNYVFTGKIPTAYEVKGQLRSRISQEARLIPAAIKNSFIVATSVMIVNLVIGSIAAYTFAWQRFRGRTFLLNFILGSRLLPVMAVAIPYYVIIQTLGLLAAAAFAFMASYNEFLFARFLTQSIDSQTGPVIISSIAGNPDASYSLISVAITLGLIPPLILAIVLRRWLTEGLSTSITLR